MASQAESAVSVGGTRSELHVLVTELSGSGLLCGGVLLLHGWIDQVAIEALVIGVTMGALMLLLGADLTPVATFVRIGREELSVDRGAERMLAQILGAGLAGWLAATVVGVTPPPEDTTLLRDAAVALLVALGAWKVSGRRRYLVMPALAVVACIAGASLLGNPLLVFAAAFGSLEYGTLPQIGPALFALTAAPVALSLLVVLRRRERDV